EDGIRDGHVTGVQTCALPISRASGAFGVLVTAHVSVIGLYRPPVFKGPNPPQTIISLSVQTAVCFARAEGALVVLVAIQASGLGLYLPPVFKTPKWPPPQTIISLLAHTARFSAQSYGAL